MYGGGFLGNPSTDTKRTKHFTEACVQEKKKNWFPVETKKDRDRHNHDLFP